MFILEKIFLSGAKETEIIDADDLNQALKIINQWIDNWKEILAAQKDPKEIIENYIEDNYTVYVSGPEELRCSKIMLYENAAGKVVEVIDIMPILTQSIDKLISWLG